ncbi:MAG: DUF4012 domain-containing protein [Patescibacteria group bacterium]|jgi:hypothetical protein
MNHQVKFRHDRTGSDVPEHREVRVTKIPESNILDLRKLTHEKISFTEEQAEQDQPPISTSTPEESPRPGRRKGNFLHAMKFRSFTKEKKSLPPVPVVLAKEPPPPPLQDAEVRWSFGVARGAVGFGIVAIVLMVPLFAASQLERVQTMQGRVLGASTEAYSSLQAGQSEISSDHLSAATEAFQDAERRFDEAREQLYSSGETLTSILKFIPRVSAADHILRAGTELSKAGKLFSQALNAATETQSAGVSFTRQLKGFSQYVSQAGEAVSAARVEMDAVQVDDVPEEFQARVSDVKKQLPVLENITRQFQQSERVLSVLLGADDPQRYLFLFQNNAEIRPTGGFIGSVALVDIDNGVLRNMEVPQGGSYDLAGQLTQKIISPTPLHLVNPGWNIQDANWFADFPTSARKVIWFYERSGGPTVDGVIAITPAVLESFLKLTGPIPVPQYNVTVDATNVVRLAQEFAEQGDDKAANVPKRFIGELMPLVITKVFSLPGNSFLELSSNLSALLEKKDVQIYFSDPDMQAEVEKLGWSGSIGVTSRDYLNVVHTNIGGGKTDRVVENLLSLSTAIEDNGDIVNTLTVTRTHRGNPLDTFEGITNVDYVRAYVPSGSVLLSAEGFERIPSWRFQTPDPEYRYDTDLASIETALLIDEATGTRITEEFGKTVFGNWMTVEPGETSVATLTYRLPFRYAVHQRPSGVQSYSLLIQKQAGVERTAFIHKIFLPFTSSFLYIDPRLVSTETNLLLSSELSTDLFFGFVAQRM